ncbi:hypothetical protein FB45DRAFT_932993 [Roridomyces roridus]|uniref:Uncharacterized protein n=1 Tax=Roridomyces roridus TaxID=1738132 RepID=A0AAD7BE10_9AGAR|nr:hypothetical protein FB45DRAFT_932993 [Roridomyces roridus]
MVLTTSTLLFAVSCVLPSAMGLTLNVPTSAVSNGAMPVTWTPAAGDPKFTLIMHDGAEGIDVATAIDPTTGNTTVNLGGIPTGSYTLEAVNAADIEKSLSTTTAFQVTAAGAAGAGDNAGGGAAAGDSTTAVAAETTTAAAATGTAAAGTASAGGPAFDPAGAKNVGNGAGGQFIGGQCLNAADCASGCCAGPSGICSGVGAQTQAGKTGCGFVSGQSSLTSSAVADAGDNAAAATTAAAATGTAAAGTASAGGPAFDPAGAKNVGNGAGGQFIGGQCLNAADCASGCCAGPSGICSGVGAQTQAGKTGCGFVSGQSSLTTAAAAAGNAAAAAPASTGAAVAGTASAGGPAFDPAGVKNVGNGKAGQFIGGQCLSAADCASGCCAGPSGICSGVGAQTQAGKTGCGFVSKRFVGRFVSSKGREMLA